MPAQQDFLQACQQGNLERVNALIARYDVSGSSWLARGTLFALKGKSEKMKATMSLNLNN